jgi:hypothetical protein
MNTFFGNFMTEISTIIDPKKQSEISSHTQITSLKRNPNISNDEEIWSLYFNGVGTGADPGFTPRVHQQALAIVPFGNTYEVDVISPKATMRGL